MSLMKRLHRRGHTVLAVTFSPGSVTEGAEPLECPRCGQTMCIVAFIREPQVIDRILDHFFAFSIVEIRQVPLGSPANEPRRL